MLSIQISVQERSRRETGEEGRGEEGGEEEGGEGKGEIPFARLRTCTSWSCLIGSTKHSTVILMLGSRAALND
jgi:hypothetical protein